MGKESVEEKKKPQRTEDGEDWQIKNDELFHVFISQYETIHRLETNKLRNVAKFFAHLLFTDAIPWTVRLLEWNDLREVRF